MDTCGAGSSPHTRGALGVEVIRGRERGIIPAYAGSTHLLDRHGLITWDHPRIRGEHSTVYEPLNTVLGSSPHTRGARSGRPAQGHAARIIPAYAGSTACRLMGREARRDHPRIRGEHADESHAAQDVQGSSPHTRGALHAPEGEGGGVGIIPAYAGSTRPLQRPPRSSRDHPRIRGEHTRKYRLR